MSHIHHFESVEYPHGGNYSPIFIMLKPYICYNYCWCPGMIILNLSRSVLLIRYRNPLWGNKGNCSKYRVITWPTIDMAQHVTYKRPFLKNLFFIQKWSKFIPVFSIISIMRQSIIKV